MAIKFKHLNVNGSNTDTGGGVVTVTELPPVEEAQEDVIYKIETPLKNRAYFVIIQGGATVIYTMEEFYKIEAGLTCTVDVIFVDELPTENILESSLENSYIALYVLNNDGSWHNFMDGEWAEANMGTCVIVDHEPTVSNVDKSTEGVFQYAWKAEGYDVSKYMFNGIDYVDITNLSMTLLDLISRRKYMPAYLFAYSDITYEELVAMKFDTLSFVGVADDIFSNCVNLVGIPPADFSGVSRLNYAFSECIRLKAILDLNTSNVTNMAYMCYGCESLEEVCQLDTRKVTYFTNIFNGCKLLKKADLTYYNIKSAMGYASQLFEDCHSITQIIIREFGTYHDIYSAFGNCYHLTGTVNETYNPEGLKDCYIYVPASMVDTLKAASEWSTYASQIRALEDYTVDGTTTGKLDESKI